jgi:hypothetical protein
MKTFVFAVALFLSFTVSSYAEGTGDMPAFRRYVTVLATSTAAYRPPGGPSDGFQKDVTPQLGYGYLVTPKLALELDAGPTFSHGDYASFSLVPGAILTLSPRFYGALRLIIPVDPEINLAISPGLGAVFNFGSRHALYVEADVASFVGRGDPDLGVTVTAGLIHSF